MKVFVLTFFLFGCFAQSDLAQSVTKEEYKIYATLLKELKKDEFKKGSKLSFVILNKTKIAETDEVSETSKEDPAVKKIEESKEWKAFLRGVNLSKTDKDFEAKNRVSVDLKRLFPVNYQYWLASRDEINRLIEVGEKDFDRMQEESKRNHKPILPEGDGRIIWRLFYEKYPNASRYFEFSRVGFSLNKRFARVDVSGTGYGWDAYTSYILKKIKSKWVIYSSWGSESIA